MPVPINLKQNPNRAMAISLDIKNEKFDFICY